MQQKDFLIHLGLVSKNGNLEQEKLSVCTLLLARGQYTHPRVFRDVMDMRSILRQWYTASPIDRRSPEARHARYALPARIIRRGEHWSR